MLDSWGNGGYLDPFEMGAGARFKVIGHFVVVF